MGIRICPECGGKVANSLDACPHCGYVFTKEIACPECGESCKSEASACPTCGHRFKVAPQEDAGAVEGNSVSENAYSTPGAFPLIDKASGNVIYGLYPQSLVTDGRIIAALEESEELENGWRFYDGHCYAWCAASVHSYQAPIFSNGEPVVRNESYWFRCDPITWRVLEAREGEYLLISTLVLDVHCYAPQDYHRTSFGAKKDFGCYPSNYAISDIRKWLNEDFYQTAFCLNDSYVQETLVDNGPSSIAMGRKSVKFACENTLDKVSLPSHEEMERNDYFNSTDARRCEASDYAKARGARGIFPSLDGGRCCDYWTRSPCGHKFNMAQEVINTGNICSHWPCDEIGVRPVITIKIDN